MPPARRALAPLVLLSALLGLAACDDQAGSGADDPRAEQDVGPDHETSDVEQPGPADDVATTPGTAAPSEAMPPSEDAPTGDAPTEEAPTTKPAVEEDPPAACLGAVDRMDEADRVGQLFMLGKDSRTPVDAAYRELLGRTRPGSVLLLGESHAGVEAVAGLTADLREAAAGPDGVGLLVAADQEGGLVQRLQGPGFDRIPTAVEQSRTEPAELLAAATTWGEQLRAAGVDATLAPVADVVPAGWVAVNEPAGRLARHYGPSAQEVQPHLAAFVQGMDAAGVATSLKHFPGLGRVVGNTDFAAGVVDTETGPGHPDLQAFAGEAGELADMVMISTAVYELIDPGVPATFSEVIIEDLLREDLGFEGVVIADDLGVAEQVSHVPPGERAVRFLAAGGDIVINAAPAVHNQMVDAVREQVRTDTDFAEEVRTKAARVLALKERRGLADCG